MRVLPAVAVLFVCACSDAPFPSGEELEVLRGLYRLKTPAVNTTNKYGTSAAAAALGERLFSDPLFSSCERIACSSCHPAPTYTLPLASPVGCNAETGTLRNIPTLANSAFHRWFYWDGRKDSLWGHAALPLLRSSEMATTMDAVRTRMAAAYAAEYESVFGTSPSTAPADRVVANFGKAIEAYLRTLVRADAPFDAHLQEFISASDANTQEQHSYYLGLKTFFRRGKCIACHRGNQLTDDSFHNLGVRENGPLDSGRVKGIDELSKDIFNGAGEFSDDRPKGQARLAGLDDELADLATTEGAFKTASLRNVAATGPYFHNGSRETLEDVLEFYDQGGDPVGTFQGVRTMTLGSRLGLTGEEKAALLQLLKDLTDPRMLPGN